MSLQTKLYKKMKKLLFIVLFAILATSMKGQLPMVFGFDNGTTQGWTTIDADNDGASWVHSMEVLGENSGYESDYCMVSYSWDSISGSLSPNNFLVSPRIHVTQNRYLKFRAKQVSSTGNYYFDHFGVAVSTTGNDNAADFTTILEGNLTYAVTSGWREILLDLSEYADQDVYIAIRHFVTGGKGYIKVDQIELVSIAEQGLYYDDGILATCVGVGGYLVWAVMFPSNMLRFFSGGCLTKVALYETHENQHDLQLKIHLGGDNAPGELVYSEIFTPLGGVEGFHFHELETPIEIDGTQNIWIVFYQIAGQFDTYPGAASNDVSGDPNGRWVSIDGFGSNWMDLAIAGLPGYTWMIRAYGTNILGVEEPLTYEALKLYPNPTTGQFTVEGANVERVEVYNLVGQKVHVAEGHVVNIDAANWDKGIYLVNIIEENGAVVTKKLVVR